MIEFFIENKMLNLFYKFYPVAHSKLKRFNILYNGYSFNESLIPLLNIYFLFFVFILPMSFIDFTLRKYNLRLSMLKKFRFYILVKLFLNNLTIFIRLNRLVGDCNVYSKI